MFITTELLFIVSSAEWFYTPVSSLHIKKSLVKDENVQRTSIKDYDNKIGHKCSHASFDTVKKITWLNPLEEIYHLDIQEYKVTRQELVSAKDLRNIMCNISLNLDISHFQGLW